MNAGSQDNTRILVSFVRGASRWIPPLAAWVRNRSQGCAALALESYRGGDLTLAETHYQEALLWQPDDAELHSALGQVYYEHSQPAEAEQQFRKALDCNYGNLRALKGLGILLQEQGGFSEAMYLYLRYLELEPKDAPVCYNLGLVFHNLGNYEKANEYYERAEKEDPEDLLTRKNRAIVLAALGRYEDAKAALARAREIAPEDAEVDHLLGIVLESLRETEAALECYKSAIRKDANDAIAHFRLGIVASALGRQQEAAEHAKTAADLYRQAGDNQASAEASGQLGWIHYLLGDWISSVQDSTEALKLAPDLTAAYFNLGLALLQLGRTDEARKEYQVGIARLDQASDLKVNVINDLREALIKNPELPGAREVLEMLETKYEAVSNELALSAQQSAQRGRQTN